MENYTDVLCAMELVMKVIQMKEIIATHQFVIGRREVSRKRFL